MYQIWVKPESSLAKGIKNSCLKFVVEVFVEKIAAGHSKDIVTGWI
jgi:hypothetical protein